MENRFKIAASERTPAVDLDFLARSLSLSGESYPEDAASFFGPLFEAIKLLLADPRGGPVRVEIALAYFNSSSAKALMNILQAMEAAAGSGTPVEVVWRHAADDEMMREFGEDFGEDLVHVRFVLESVEGAA
ncbi:MAG: DUF1987 domain-containing protein [Alphaproteobacteria bacterium]|nr:DUF1987 domain-containing protein [Alphaproteobacteria bacterium]MBF0335739.1 DUF1987 domain-containing protein [Alphaproteobacteria bacterium]